MLVKDPWFKRKAYGYGWAPAKLEGWLVIILYFIMLLNVIATANLTEHSKPMLVWIIMPQVLFYTALLLIITLLTGEKPRWQWGKHKRVLKSKKRRR